MGDKGAQGTYKLGVGEEAGGMKKVCVGGGFAMVPSDWKPPGRPKSGRAPRPTKARKAQGTFKVSVGEEVGGLIKKYIGNGHFRMVQEDWTPPGRGATMGVRG